mmetsp:Transcript_97206/g.187365  ORF Transcript_97206/g.187365 Transcript_97206/m.187365 type:complete len:708 (-) Transcript_97206:170-2293(-)
MRGQARNVLMENQPSSGSDLEDSGSDDDIEEVAKPAVVDPRDQVSLQQKLQKLTHEDAEIERTLAQVKEKTEANEKRIEKLNKEIKQAEEELHNVEHPALVEIALNERAKSKRQNEIQEMEEEMAKASEVWKKRRVSLEVKLSKKQSEMKKLTLDIRNLTLAVNGEVPPVGPKWLSWLDGDIWTVISSMVIIANMWVMIYEMRHPGMDQVLRGLDNSFLLFYIIELVLKAIYRQQHLICGPPWAVWANWLDVVIVLTGIIELCIELAGVGDAAKYLNYLRALRLFRLARVGKIVVLLLTRDLSWAKSQAFQSFILGIIAFNCILMGFEIEFPHFKYWPVIENILLVIYTFELMLRLRLAGCSFFCECKELFWNYLDFIIVAGAIFDQWVRPTAEMLKVLSLSGEQPVHGSSGQVFNLLRLLRLMRLLRLVKLIKHIGPLYTLAVGIAKAMHGMGWVMMLAVCTLYIGALLAVKLIGEGLVFKPEDLYGYANETENGTYENGTINRTKMMEEYTGLQAGFTSIPDAMFNLFKVMNCDTSGVDPLVFKTWWLRWLIIVFTIVANWAIFSILTAVVSDNMAQVTEDHETELAQERSAKKKEVVAERIGQMFEAVDENKSHTMDEKEFKDMLADEARAQEFEEITGINHEDAEQLFEVTSRRRQRAGVGLVEETSHEDFIASLNKEGEEVTQRSIMKIDKRLAELESLIQS